MLNNFQSPNSTLSQDLYEEARAVFDESETTIRLRSFENLAAMLRSMKLPIPESMLTQINRCLNVYPTPKFCFSAFTHFVARATLEQQLQEEMRNLFFHIDRRKTGRVDSEDLIELLNELNGGEKIGEEGVNDLLGEMDFMRVGYLNYQDFVYLLLPK